MIIQLKNIKPPITPAYSHKCTPSSLWHPTRNHKLQVTSAYNGQPNNLIVLPVFESHQVLLPTAGGLLTIYEPRYLQLFKHLQAAYPQGGGSFLHILSSQSAPIGLTDQPRVGCAAKITSATSQLNGTLLVQYEGYRRVQVLLTNDANSNTIENDNDIVLPYTTVAAEWYDDLPADELETSSVASLDAAERDLAFALKALQRVLGQLSPGKSLPDAVLKYAPVPGAPRTSYDALKKAGHKAAVAIDTWRRHGSVYSIRNSSSSSSSGGNDRVQGEAKVKSNSHTTGRGSGGQSQQPDPYTEFQQQLEGTASRRQELFSFAAAQLLDAGTVEYSALLLSRDTEARMAFVLNAVRPYLNQLSAELAVQNALDSPH
jgi:Lon protease-like protein